MLRRTCAVFFLVFVFLAGAPGFAHALGVRISAAECRDPGLHSSHTTQGGENR
jgi:hypothetical protein